MTDHRVVVSFSPYLSSDAKIVEVSNDLVKDIERGSKLTLKGSATEEAVLCTSERTFALKRMEQSNAVFLFNLDKVAPTWELQAICKNFFETIPSEGRLSSIKAFLEGQSSQGGGRSYEEVLEFLFSNVQASDSEIKDRLHVLGAVNVDGMLRLVTFDSLLEYLEQFFAASIQRDWDLVALSEDNVSTVMANVNLAIIRHVLSHLGTCSAEKPFTWTLDDKLVARYVIHLAFLRSQSLSLDELKAEFLLRAPGNVSSAIFDTSLLTGIAVETPKRGSGQFAYFPAERMSVDFSTCLRSLYSLRKEFTLEELTPYCKKYMSATSPTAGAIVELLLLHTRLIDGTYRLKE